MKREKVYVDMDGVLCDFFKSASEALKKYPEQKYTQSQWGFFLKLEEMSGAIEGFRKLEEKYDVWILTRPSSEMLTVIQRKHNGFGTI